MVTSSKETTVEGDKALILDKGYLSIMVQALYVMSKDIPVSWFCHLTRYGILEKLV